MTFPFGDQTQFGDPLTDPTPAHHAWTHFPGGSDEIPGLARLFELIAALRAQGAEGLDTFFEGFDELTA